MSLTITGTITTGVTLSSSAENPVTVTKAGYLGGSLALYGPAGTAWTVTNAGMLNGSLYGIELAAGGSVTNQKSGVIAGGQDGVFINGGAGTVSNSGIITGTSKFGVALFGGGSVSNLKTGTISGGVDGIEVVAGPGTITNNGTITDNGALNGPDAGIYVFGGSGTVTNTGAIVGGRGTGVKFNGGGQVGNSATGSISGNYGVYITNQAGTVTNDGTITGQGEAGIFLGQGGTILNRAGGTISGLTLGIDVARAAGTVINKGITTGEIYLFSGGTVTNDGVITGNTNSVIGVQINGGGGVTNGVAGSISAYTGVYFNLAAGTVTNSGQITGSISCGVCFGDGGTVTNKASGTIIGNGYGVLGVNTITNDGLISSQGAAIATGSGPTVVITNNASGVIRGGAQLPSGGTATGVLVYSSPGAVMNSGLISGGVDLGDGGTLTNKAAGTITGNTVGTYGAAGVTVQNGAGTVINSGTISGGPGGVAVAMSNNAGDRVAVDPGAVFIGSVNGGTGTLELRKGTGSLAGIDTGQFANFQTLAVDKGGNWTLTGANSIATATVNGTVAVAGLLNITTAIDPASTGGVFQLEAGGTLTIAAALGAGTKMQFLGSSELVIGNAASFGSNVGLTTYTGSQLQDFGAGDMVDIQNFGTAGLTDIYTKATDLLQISNGASQVATLDFQHTTLGSGSFHIIGDGGSGILITHS